MQTSRKLTHALVALFMLVMMSMAALAADPGTAYPAASEISDQKAGSILVYNYYTSNLANVLKENTVINMTNTNPSRDVWVHLFFVAANCTVADYKIELTRNQTWSVTAEAFDPGFSGYLIAIAEDGATGLPISFNYLIGDEYIKSLIGNANLGAEAISALYEEGTTLPGATADTASATLPLNGVVYNKVPTVLAASSIPSRKDLNETTIILNSIRGDLTLGLTALASRIPVLLYDDQENVYSSSLAVGACQRAITLTNTTIRVVNGGFEGVIGEDTTGWMKINANGSDTAAMLGAMINVNPNADGFNGGHNLHILRLTNSSLSVPVFPSSGF